MTVTQLLVPPLILFLHYLVQVRVIKIAIPLRRRCCLIYKNKNSLDLLVVVTYYCPCLILFEYCILGVLGFWGAKHRFVLPTWLLASHMAREHHQWLGSQLTS